jgi:hypothetical protein
VKRSFIRKVCDIGCCWIGEVLLIRFLIEKLDCFECDVVDMVMGLIRTGIIWTLIGESVVMDIVSLL